MPVARITAPDGRVARITVPEGASQEEAHAVIADFLSKLSAPPVAEAPVPKFGDPGVGDSDVPGYTPLPEEMPQAAPEQNLWQKARPYVAPTVETLGAAGGGLAGGFLGGAAGGIGAIPGSAVGAGLGYAGAKELMEMGDVYFGGKAPRQGIEQQVAIPVRNVLEGAAYELGGQVAAPIIAKGVAKTVGTLKDLAPSRRAAVNILRESTEGKAQQVRNALKAGRTGELPAETLAREGVNVPVTQNLLKDVKSGAPTHFSDIGLAKETKHMDDLAKIAGGKTQLGSLESRMAAKSQLQADTIPLRDIALKHAEELSDIMKGIPEGSTSPVATRDAARRLEEAGLKPLDSELLITKIEGIKSPKQAGNDIIDATIRDVSNEIRDWTKTNGVVDPVALDSILKNTVNATVSRLRPGFDAKTQSNAAAKALKKLNPIIDDAIERAGGHGYKAYKAAYREGMNELANTKMAAKLMDHYRKGNADKFIDILDGNAPTDVEKILGPGRRNLEVELGEKEFSKLRKIADDLKVTKEIDSQVSTEGAKDAMRRIVEEHSKKFKVPDMLNVIATTSNKVLGVVESKVNKKTFKLLTEAAKNSKTLGELLDSVPSAERAKVIKLLEDAETFSKLIPRKTSDEIRALSSKGVGLGGAGVTGKNALSEKREKRNALSR